MASEGSQSGVHPSHHGFLRLADAAIALFEEARTAAKAQSTSAAAAFFPLKSVGDKNAAADSSVAADSSPPSPSLPWAPSLQNAASAVKEALDSFAASGPELNAAPAESTPRADEQPDDAAAAGDGKPAAKPDLLAQFSESIRSLLDAVAVVADPPKS